MKDITFKLTSASPLLMHNAQLADPLNKWTKEIKRVSGKRKKVDADHEEMARLEFLGGLYMMKSGKTLVPCLPSAMIEAALVGAARTQKRGKQAQSGIYVMSDTPLIYDGPKDADELYAKDEFRLRCAARVGQARIMRTRPIFRAWKAEVVVSYHDSDVDHDVLRDLVQIAGEVIGVGDWRPKFGRFNLSKL
jgi:hypothetical protein